MLLSFASSSGLIREIQTKLGFLDRIINSDAYNKYINDQKKEITNNDLKKLFKIDDYTTLKDLEKRIVKLLDNFPEKHSVYQIINNYRKEVKKYVN